MMRVMVWVMMVMGWGWGSKSPIMMRMVMHTKLLKAILLVSSGGL